MTAIWPNQRGDLEVISAILNGPVANAYVAEHEHGKHITKDTLKQIPIVELSNDDHGEVRRLVKGIQSILWICVRLK